MRKTATILLVSLFISLMPLAGCDTVGQWFGAPSKEEVQKVRAQYDAAEKQLTQAEKDKAELEAAIAEAKRRNDDLLSKRDTLAALQAKVALELANADSDAARGFLEDQMAAISRERKALVDKTGAMAESIAAYQARFASISAGVATATADLEEQDKQLDALQSRYESAAESAKGTVSGLVKTVGQVFPPAAAVTGPLGDALSNYGGWASIVGMGGVGTLFVRNRRRLAEAKEQAAKTGSALEQLVNGLDAAQDPELNPAAPTMRAALSAAKLAIRAKMDTSAQEIVDSLRK